MTYCPPGGGIAVVTSPVRTRRPRGGAAGAGWAAPVVGNGTAPDGELDQLDQLLASIGVASPMGHVTPVAGPVALSPVQAAARLLDRRQLVLLDHSSGATATSRYSYVSADPFLILRSRGRHSELAGPDGTVTVTTDPPHLLERLLRRYAVPRQPGLPPLLGGAVGYFGYDLGRRFERWPARARDEGRTRPPRGVLRLGARRRSPYRATVAHQYRVAAREHSGGPRAVARAASVPGAEPDAAYQRRFD